MKTVEKLVGIIGLILTVAVILGGAWYLFISLAPEEGAIHFEGDAVNGTQMIMKDGTLHLVGSGAIAWSSPLTWKIRRILLAVYFVFCAVSSLLLVKKTRKETGQE